MTTKISTALLNVAAAVKSFLDGADAAAMRTAIGATAAGSAAITGTATVIDRAYAEYTASANLTTQIPADDTIPQNTEGTEIISVSFTPKSTTNRLRLRFQGVASASTGPANLIVALFSSASANAIAAEAVITPAADSYEHIGVEYEYVPATTSALTFTVRAGPGNGVTMRMNGTSTTRLLGGTQHATLVIEEIAA